jgi:hypothetical protein
MAKKKPKPPEGLLPTADYNGLLGEVVSLLETARRTSARAVNAVMTATYWQIGRRIVEVEQAGAAQAEYGEELVKRLAVDLSARFGRGFSWRNLYRMRSFHLAYRDILPTPSAKSEGAAIAGAEILPTVSAKLQPVATTGITLIERLANLFPLPWSHYEKRFFAF